MSTSQYVLDADAASFQSLVIDESRRVPVLVDFWAEWCGPCRALAPVLEKLADEFRGRFLVVKVDTDREQEVSAQFGIRSLPTVKLFKDGAVVDEFMGAQPESQVRAILERYVSRESDDARVEARVLVERGEPEQARALLENAHAADPNDCESRYRLAALQITRGDYESALDQFMEILRTDRSFRDDAGRKGMLSVFEMLGSDDPLVGRYRSRMSSLLY